MNYVDFESISKKEKEKTGWKYGPEKTLYLDSFDAVLLIKRISMYLKFRINLR